MQVVVVGAGIWGCTVAHVDAQAADGYNALFGYRFGALPWRSLRFETEKLSVRDYQGTSVVNYTEAERLPNVDVRDKPNGGHGHTIAIRLANGSWVAE